MELTIAPNGHLQIDDARLIFRNFRGIGGPKNREGDRNFCVVIPTEEMAEALTNDKNRFGVGWNVKVKEPMNEGDTPRMHLKVKVKFTGRGPNVYLIVGDKRRKLTEEEIGRLDRIDIARVDLDIRPYDDEMMSGPFRAAYLHAMEVVQELDRFEARWQDDEDEYEE